MAFHRRRPVPVRRQPHGAQARAQPLLAPGREPGERIGEASPLSGADAHAILEDREGNVWIATDNGLDRFRPNRLLRSGLPGPGNAYSVATDAQGRTWAADIRTGTLWQLGTGQAPVADTSGYVAVVATDRHGDLLLAGKRAIERRGSDGTERIPLPPGPDGKPADLHLIGMLDDGKVLWCRAPGSRRCASQRWAGWARCCTAGACAT
jgi:ligand-binding sensor domain-containing protein